jgi:hypothetical protein
LGKGLAHNASSVAARPEESEPRIDDRAEATLNCEAAQATPLCREIKGHYSMVSARSQRGRHCIFRWLRLQIRIDPAKTYALHSNSSFHGAAAERHNRRAHILEEGSSFGSELLPVARSSIRE